MKPKVAEKLTQLDEIGQEEILMLRCFDPDRFFLGSSKEKWISQHETTIRFLVALKQAWTSCL